MAKKTKLPKLPPLSAALVAFSDLSPEDKLKFMASIPFQWAIQHPEVARLLKKVGKVVVETAKAVRPKKHGERKRDDIIERLAREGLSDGEIMIHPEIVKANGGRMTRGAVAKQRRNRGIIKKR